MKLRYMFILPLAFMLVFAGSQYLKQRGNKQVIYPPTKAVGCTPTTGVIDGDILGINSPPGGLAKEDVPYLLDLGVKWMRGGVVGWQYVEPTEGVYEWRESDEVVRMASEHNITLLSGLVGDIPEWVWAKDKQGRQDAAYAFAKTVAARYKGKVRYWEIGNEPNLPGYGFFRETDKVDAGTYLDFLAAANRGVHEVDPSAVIILGGLNEVDWGFPGPFAFMDDIYALGGKDCFDVLAYHPYGSAGHFKEKADAIRAYLVSSGDPAKPIWFNEFGATVEDGTAQVTAMNQMKAELGAVPVWIWFDLRDWGAKPDEMYGLLTRDFEKRPSYDLFKQLLKSR